MRDLLEAIVGRSTFEIWLEPTELMAIDREGRLVIAVPEATAAWTADRFGRLLVKRADRVGRGLRFATNFQQPAAPQSSSC